MEKMRGVILTEARVDWVPVKLVLTETGVGWDDHRATCAKRTLQVHESVLDESASTRIVEALLGFPSLRRSMLHQATSRSAVLRRISIAEYPKGKLRTLRGDKRLLRSL